MSQVGFYKSLQLRRLFRVILFFQMLIHIGQNISTKRCPTYLDYNRVMGTHTLLHKNQFDIYYVEEGCQDEKV